MTPQDIIMTKWIALAGTVRLARTDTKRLYARFPRDLVETAADFVRFLPVVEDMACAGECGVTYMAEMGADGIFGALWRLGEENGVGLAVDLTRIRIRQETVELCEFFHENPYRMASEGSLLAVLPDGNALVQALAKRGIPAAVIGRTRKENGRVLYNKEHIEYIGKC